jgi:hypothetical protein
MPNIHRPLAVCNAQFEFLNPPWVFALVCNKPGNIVVESVFFPILDTDIDARRFQFVSVPRETAPVAKQTIVKFRERQFTSEDKSEDLNTQNISGMRLPRLIPVPAARIETSGNCKRGISLPPP